MVKDVVSRSLADNQNNVEAEAPPVKSPKAAVSKQGSDLMTIFKEKLRNAHSSGVSWVECYKNINASRYIKDKFIRDQMRDELKELWDNLSKA